MSTSYFETIGRATDAPPDISKTNYLATEADFTESVNKNIDDISGKWDDHFNQMIRIWDHIHTNREKQKGFLGQVAHLLKDAETFQEDYKQWDDFAKSYYPYARKLRQEELRIANTYGYGSAEFKQWQSTAGSTHDTEVKNENLNRDNQELIKSTSSQAAYEVYPNNLELAKQFMYGPGGSYSQDKERYQDISDLKDTVYPNWLTFAKESLKVPITLENGQVVYKTFNEAHGNWKEQEQILLTINGWFAYMHKDSAQGRMGLYKRELINTMTAEVTTEKKKALEDGTAAFLETSMQNKGEELSARIASDPGYVLNWLKGMVGNPEFNSKGIHSHKLAKEGLTKEIVTLIEGEHLSRSDLQPWLDYIPPDGWFDGSKIPVRDYWKKHARQINAALLKQEKDKAEYLRNEKEGAELEWVNQVVESANNLEVPMTVDKRRELITRGRNKFGYGPTSKLPDHFQPLLDIAYQGMKDDNNIVSDLYYRKYTLNHQIVLGDLVGITDPTLKQKLIKDLVDDPGGLTKGSESTPGSIGYRNARVTGIVNSYLNRTKTDSARDLVWFANFDQAIKFFDRKYNEYRATGMSPELASSKALQDTENEITKTKDVPVPGKPGEFRKVPIWDTYKTITKTQVNALQDQAKLAIAINKNRDLLNSEQPLEGELEHLKVAAKYLQSFKEGNRAPFPEIYRYLGSRLKIDPIKLMKTRLEATGLLDGDEIFIHEEGKPGERDLVNPNPSKTLRVVYKQLKENNTTDNFGDYQWMINSSVKKEALDNGGYLAIKNREGKYVNIEEVLEKPLEEITLGDVWSLGSGGYTNIGIFDFTWKGLEDLIRESGIPLNTSWGPEGQNLLYLARLRQKAQRAQQSTGVVTDYRRLTAYIDKDKHEEFLRIVGKLPPWLDPNTLSNGAAKELFKNLLVLQEPEK